jgi:hypothetical protein
MWIFLNNAFFSIVENRNDSSELLVRSRIREDLSNTFGLNHEIIEMEDSDYRFRMFLNREYVASVLLENAMNINYDNFKDSIPEEDEDRSYYYTRVWQVMHEWQTEQY